MVHLNEAQLKQIIKESVHQYLMEMDDDGYDSAIQQAMDKCINIILKTETAGRGFDFRGHDGILAQDQKYQDLKNEVIDSMAAYFQSAKTLLQYLCQISQHEYTKQNGMKYLNKTFKPTWADR